jgi:hypothetical protein
MIDVHMLTLPETRADWADCALADMRGEPASVHVVRGTPGNIGDGRARGFARGDLPYVSFIDPDDRYPAGGLRHCLAVLEREPDVGLVYTSELRVNEELMPMGKPDMRLHDASAHRESPLRVHGLMVFRRAAVMPHLTELPDFPRVPEWRLTTRIAESCRIVKLPFVGRLWRQHATNASRQPDMDGLARRDRERVRA